MSQDYFFFVSGLPNQSLEDTKLTITPPQFREQAKAQLSPHDYRMVEELHLPQEFDALLGALYRDNRPEHPEALFSTEYWQGFIAFCAQLLENPSLPHPAEYAVQPQFVFDTTLKVLNQEDRQPKLQTEQELITGLYGWSEKHGNEFIRMWFALDARIRNILMAINGRKLDLPYAQYLVGSGETVDKLAKSHAADFGLGKQDDLYEQLIRIYEQNNILYRERAYDILKWKWIDSLNFFKYFNIDRILGYYSKLRIEARWILADPNVGKTIFQDTLDALENSFSFPEDFNI